MRGEDLQTANLELRELAADPIIVKLKGANRKVLPCNLINICRVVNANQRLRAATRDSFQPIDPEF